MNELNNKSGQYADHVLIADPKQREEGCRLEVQKALKRWRCVVQPVVTIVGSPVTGPRIIPSIEIRAVITDPGENSNDKT